MNDPATDSELLVHAHWDKAFEVFAELWQQRRLCDIVLCVDSKQFHAHRVVLAGCSPYLRAMFTNGMLESAKAQVELRDIEANTMDLLLTYMYSGRIKVGFDNVQPLLEGASMLSLGRLRTACSQFLAQHIDETNCLGIQALADMYSCVDLFSQAQDFIDRHFVDVVHGEEFNHLPVERLIKLLENENIQVRSEEQVVEAAVLWVGWDSDKRYKHAARVLECVHLNMLPAAYLHQFLLKTEFVAQCIDCQELVKEAIVEREEEEKDEDRMSSGGSSIDADCRISTHGIYVLGGRNREDCQLKSMERYDTLRQQWIPMPCMSVARTAVGACAVDGEMYVLGGECALEDGQEETMYLKCVEVFDPACFQWMPVADLLVPRSFVSTCTLDGYIYAIGGENRDQSLQSMERYDPRRDQWLPQPSMLHRRAGCGIALHDNKIYVTGGSDKALFLDRTSVECYDPDRRRWHLVAEMEKGRSGLVTVCIRQNLYMIGGRARYLDRYYSLVERYNLHTGEWTTCCSMNTPRAWPAAVVLDNKIYVIGGYNGTNRLRSVEMYDPDTDTWNYISNITVCRAGCAACVL